MHYAEKVTTEPGSDTGQRGWGLLERNTGLPAVSRPLGKSRSHRAIQGNGKERGCRSRKQVVQILPLTGCATLASQGTSPNFCGEDNEVSGEDAQKVPPAAASLDSPEWGRSVGRYNPSGEWQHNMTGGTGTGAGPGWVALFFPEQWPERRWGRGSE